MKKLIGIFTVLLVLSASSAFALTAEFPAYYNGTIAGYAAGTDTANSTQLFITGFGVNASGLRDSATVKSYGRMNMFRSEIQTAAAKSDLLLVNGTRASYNGGNLNGTIVYTNGTGAAETMLSSFSTALRSAAAGASYFTYDVTAGSTAGSQIGGLVSMGAGNSTLNATTYFVPASGYQLMVGITNASSNMTDAVAGGSNVDSSAAGSGISMSMLYQNGTVKDIADGATWDYYAYGTTKNDPVVVFGQVQINSAYDSASTTGNAQARYFLVNGTDTVDQSDWAYYNATTYKAAAGGNIKLERDDTDYITLFDNSTINVDKNMVTGFVNAAGKKLFAVMVKSGSDLSNSYLMNKGYSAVYTGSGRAGHEKGNATAGLMQFRVDGNMELTGAAHNWYVDDSAGRVLVNIDRDETDLDQYSVDVTSTSQFKIAQTNATFKDVNGNVIGHFYGKRSSDDTFAVGIYESYVNKDFRDTSIAYRSLAFLIPTAATTSVVSGAAANYQTNASMTTTSGTNYTRNSTGYTKTQLLANWTGIASDFVPLTDVKGYTLTSSGKMGPGKDFYYTAKFDMTGVAGKVSDLALYKVMIDGSSAHLLTYADNEATTTDGAWWISRADGSGFLGSNSVIEATDEVVVNWVVKDNGSYDTNNTIDGGIVDPVVLGLAGSSSSSSGCVFNPAAGFGLEWLLLMLAPMVAIVRSRFK
ncbi:hypothetical protein D0S45_05515 [Marinifilum sp. JC120]|nr:hypothetical protein D0S45_05515 [Marinifilum sp. JC120]